MPQLFFTSYAHVNHDRYLVKFVQELGQEVLQRAPGRLQPEDVVFFDSEGIQTGEEWVKKLSSAVAQCKVCVAICSPAYVSSEFCGKEIQIFLDRLQQWETLSRNSGVPGRPIIPVIWVKIILPDMLGRFQYDEEGFPPDYREHGLRTLYQLSKYKSKRTEVILTLTERIITAAEMALPPRGPIPHFDQISSIFHEQPRGTRYGVALVALLKGGVEAKPYGQELTFRNLMHKACASQIPWRPLEQDGQLAQRLREAKANREAILIATDLETLQDQLYMQTVAAVDSVAGEQSAILLVGPEGSSAAATLERNAEITLNGCFPNAFPQAWHRDWRSIRSVKSLDETLAETMYRLRRRLVDEDPPLKARDSKIAAAAAAAGVPIERQPVLTGPGGQAA